MTTSYYADRINLLYMLQQHPDWTQSRASPGPGPFAGLGEKMATTDSPSAGSWRAFGRGTARRLVCP